MRHLDVPLTDERIESLITELRHADFPAHDTVELTEALAHHGWGDVAEAALAEALRRIPTERLDLLVSRHVMARPDSRPLLDYTGRQSDEVERKLGEIGLPASDGESRWSLRLPDGTELTGEYEAASDDGAGRDADTRSAALCRLALHGVWLRTMRSRRKRGEGGT